MPLFVMTFVPYALGTFQEPANLEDYECRCVIYYLSLTMLCYGGLPSHGVGSLMSAGRCVRRTPPLLIHDRGGGPEQRPTDADRLLFRRI